MGRTDKTCPVASLSRFQSAQGQVKSHEGGTDPALLVWNVALNWWIRPYFGSKSYLQCSLHYTSEIHHYDERPLSFHCTTYSGRILFTCICNWDALSDICRWKGNTLSHGIKAETGNEAIQDDANVSLHKLEVSSLIWCLSSTTEGSIPSFTKHNWQMTIK